MAAPLLLPLLAGFLPGAAAVEGPPLDAGLERELRAWWGNVWFGESQRLLEEDRRDAGFELSGGLDEDVQAVFRKVIARRASGARCSELPLEIALHAWRYNQTDLDRCLSGSAGPSCSLACAGLPSVGASLKCWQGAEGGWALAGSPPESRCKWTLDGEVVNTTGGLVRALVRPLPWLWPGGRVTSEQVRIFWGVPYADRPERFGLARPLSQRWGGVRAADYYSLRGNASLRMHCAGAAPLDNGHGTEDCLFLDVYVPPNASAATPRPVVVLLFASGFVNGDAWMGGGTDAAARVALRDDVVFVVLSARAAALGHWAHPALSAEYGDGSAGNLGERDQRLALRWLRTNARGLGGDPARVTLLGHSSGAFQAAFHLASPGSTGLFSGAALESATLDSGWYWQGREQAYAFYAGLGEALGCARDRGGGEQVRCLRALPARAFFDLSAAQGRAALARLRDASALTDLWALLRSVVAATTGIRGGYRKAGLAKGDSQILSTPLWPILPFGLIVDGTDAGVPAPPRELYEAGQGADVPVYLSHMHDEGTVFAAVLGATFPWQANFALTHSAVEAMIDWAFGGNASFTRDLLRRYPRGTHAAAPFYRLSSVITDAVFRCSARRFAGARSLRRRGRTFWAEHTFPGTVKSRSTAEALLRREANYFLGASHNLPTAQILGGSFATNQGLLWEELDQRNHELMHCHFALMFHCGDPGARPGSTCRQGAAEKGAMPLACLEVPEDAVFPFEAFDPERRHRNQLSPTNHTPIAPSPEEEAVCRFWDSAPPMSLRPNACRGCAAAAAGELAPALLV
uniref:Carboxylesterase type B domain-containing protein n=1 Tax=Alexandrium monilatum TaxID=311494 RepID=A0A7S4RIT8_9DINO